MDVMQCVDARDDWSRFVGSDWQQRIMHIQVTDQFHAKQGRSTGRCVFTQGDRQLSVFLKRHHRLPWWRGVLARILPGRGWSPAAQEYRNLQWARQQGIPVAPPVAVGEVLGPGCSLQSFLAVEELTGMLPLHEAIPAAARQLDRVSFARWKRGLTAELARLANELHGRRRFHKDLYLCHFFIRVEDTHFVPDWHGRVTMIDLQRLGHHRWTWPFWQIKDIAQFLFSSDLAPITARDRLRFWRLYYGPGYRSPFARCLAWMIQRKWLRYLRHNEKRYGYKVVSYRRKAVSVQLSAVSSQRLDPCFARAEAAKSATFES